MARKPACKNPTLRDPVAVVTALALVVVAAVSAGREMLLFNGYC